MLRHRVISGLAMGAVVVAAALWGPAVLVAGLLAAVAAVAGLELLWLLGGRRREERLLCGAGSAVLVLATWWGLARGGPGLAAQVEVAVLAAYVGLVALWALFRRGGGAAPAVPALVLALLYGPFLFNFLTKILFAWEDGEGRLLCLYLLAVVKFTDIGAYFTGRAVGRRRMFPRISPAKTWEGTAGGVVAAVVASLVVWAISGGDFGVVRLRAADAVALPLLLAAAGILGDLVESMFKRAAEVKDSGRFIRGMGGMLDVVDSLLLAAPVMYVYSRLWLERA